MTQTSIYIYVHVCTTVHTDEGIKRQIPVTVTLSDIWKYTFTFTLLCPWVSAYQRAYMHIWLKCLICKMFLKRYITS